MRMSKSQLEVSFGLKRFKQAFLLSFCSYHNQEQIQIRFQPVKKEQKARLLLLVVLLILNCGKKDK